MIILQDELIISCIMPFIQQNKNNCFTYIFVQVIINYNSLFAKELNKNHNLIDNYLHAHKY